MPVMVSAYDPVGKLSPPTVIVDDPEPSTEFVAKLAVVPGA
jgi:hypothetical protein